MIVALEVTNTGAEPITFDDRTGRWIWVIRDEADTPLCDVGGHSPRLGSEFVSTIVLEPGGTHRDAMLLNSVCPAFTKSGRYRVSVVALLSKARAMSPPRACEDLIPEREPDDAGTVASTLPDGGCADVLRDFPAVAAELTIEVGAWDAPALRKRVATLIDEEMAARKARDRGLSGALSAYEYWFCDHLTCDCPPHWERYGKWFAKVSTRVPDAMPGRCPRR